MDEAVRPYVVQMIRDYARRAQLLANMEAQALPGVPIAHLTGMPRPQGPGDPTVRAAIRWEAARAEQEALRQDMEAVGRAIQAAERMDGGVWLLKAVREVYWAPPYHRPLARGEVTDRIRRAAVTLPSSERQVYRWLKEFRAMVVRERGLRG